MAAIDNNLKAFKLLFEIETALREFLIERCEQSIGPRWHETVFPKITLERLKTHGEPKPGAKGPGEKRSADDKKGWVSRVAFHPVYYLDFSELADAFELKTNNDLDRLFVSNRRDVIVQHLRRAMPIRNPIAHNRMIVEIDLATVQNSYVGIRNEIGAELFDRYASSPPSQVAKDAEMKQLRTELRTSAAAVRAATEVSLPVWDRLKQRWWMELDWQLDAKSVREVFKLLEGYREVWNQNFLGRRQRMLDWYEPNWNAANFDRAMASLERDSTLAETQIS